MHGICLHYRMPFRQFGAFSSCSMALALQRRMIRACAQAPTPGYPATRRPVAQDCPPECPSQLLAEPPGARLGTDRLLNFNSPKPGPAPIVRDLSV